MSDDNITTEDKIADLLIAVEIMTDYIKDMQTTINSLDDRLTEIEELAESGEIVIDADFDFDPPN